MKSEPNTVSNRTGNERRHKNSHHVGRSRHHGSGAANLAHGPKLSEYETRGVLIWATTGLDRLTPQPCVEVALQQRCLLLARHLEHHAFAIRHDAQHGRSLAGALEDQSRLDGPRIIRQAESPWVLPAACLCAAIR